jgi:hypothetical protein
LVDVFGDDPEAIAVSLASRQVCTFMGSNQTSVNVVGQDGGESVKLGNLTYWMFGDTMIDRNNNDEWDGEAIDHMEPNNVGYSVDQDASNCLDIFNKNAQVNGNAEAIATIDKAFGEISVYPVGWAEPTSQNPPDTTLKYFYTSMHPDPNPDPPYEPVINGVGVGQMTVSTMDSVRLPSGCTSVSLDACLFWKFEASPCSFKIASATALRATLPNQSTEYVYVFLDTDLGKGLARVQFSNIAVKTAYEYWTGTSWSSPLQHERAIPGNVR